MKLINETIQSNKIQMNDTSQPDAYNLLTMLMDMSSQEGNQINLSHPEFAYNTIGYARETAANEDTGFKPVFSDDAGEVLADTMSLNFNEDRPNISILVKRNGSVSLPENSHGFGDSFDSFVWRNYTIVKDGIVNLRKLPVVLSKVTYDKLFKEGVITEPFKVNKTFVIDTKSLPIINRNMTKPGTARDLFDLYFEVITLKTKQKYLGSKIEKPAFGAGFAAKYGEDGATFLKGLGISEGGFSPKTVKGVSLDPYVSKVLEVKIAGFSSIPSVSDVEKDIAANKKLTPSKKVMADVIEALQSCKDYEAELKATKIAIKERMNDIVRRKFGIILGKKMPTDVTNPEDTTQEIDYGFDKPVKCSFILSDKEV